MADRCAGAVDALSALQTVAQLFSSDETTGSSQTGRVCKVVKSPSTRKVAKKRPAPAHKASEKVSEDEDEADAERKRLRRERAFVSLPTNDKVCAFSSCGENNPYKLQVLPIVMKRAISWLIQVTPDMKKQNDLIMAYLQYVSGEQNRGAARVSLKEFPFRICSRHFINEIGGDLPVPRLPPSDSRLHCGFKPEALAAELRRRISILSPNLDLCNSFVPQGEPRNFVRCGIRGCESTTLTVNPNAFRLFRLFPVPTRSDRVSLEKWVKVLSQKEVEITIQSLSHRAFVCEMHFYGGDPDAAWDWYLARMEDGSLKEDKHAESHPVSPDEPVVECVVRSCNISSKSCKSTGSRFVFYEFPSDISRFNDWMRELCFADGRYVNPINPKTSRICERHFERDDSGEIADLSVPTLYLRSRYVAHRLPGAVSGNCKDVPAPSASTKRICCAECELLTQLIKKLSKKATQLHSMLSLLVLNLGIKSDDWLSQKTAIEEGKEGTEIAEDGDGTVENLTVAVKQLAQVRHQYAKANTALVQHATNLQHLPGPKQPFSLHDVLAEDSGSGSDFGEETFDWAEEEGDMAGLDEEFFD